MRHGPARIRSLGAAAALAAACSSGSSEEAAGGGGVQSPAQSIQQPGGLAFATDALPAGAKGIVYNASVDAAGGAPPYRFRVTDGALPSGLSLHRDTGDVSGVPEALGESEFQVTVSDSKKAFVRRRFSIGVSPPAARAIPVSKAFRADAAKSHDLQPGLHAVIGRGYGVHRVVPLDWAEADLACSFTTAVLEGEFDLANLGLTSVLTERLPARAGRKTWDLVVELDGWLWVDVAGDLGLRIRSIDDDAVVEFEGAEVLARGGTQETVVRGVERGFHRLRVVHRNAKREYSLVLEMREPGGEWRIVPASRLFHGPVIDECPLLTATAVHNAPFSHKLAVRAAAKPFSLSLVQGALPTGLKLAADGTIAGTPSEPGTKYFTVRLAGANGLSSQRALALHVFGATPKKTRNDSDAFALTFEESGRNPVPGIRFPADAFQSVAPLDLGAGGMALTPWHGYAGDDRMKITHELGALGSKGSVAIPTKELGFYLKGDQNEHLSDYFPAVRRANRFAVMFRAPDSVKRPEGTYSWSADPQAYAQHVFSSLVMAGHNVTRWQGHEKEERNWHFYHKVNHYWDDDWQSAVVRYLGNGWYYFETSDEVTSQRSGPGTLTAFYTPMEEYGLPYFETLSRLYLAVDGGWGATDNTYEDPVFHFDNIRLWRVESQVSITTRGGAATHREAVAIGANTVDVPFRVKYTGKRRVSYRIAQYDGKTPHFGGGGIYVDEDGDGEIDPGEPELKGERLTPAFAPGQTRDFVYRVNTANAPLDKTVVHGIHLRVRDRHDVFSLDGDSLMILLFKSGEPSAVELSNLHVNTGVTAYGDPNAPPVAKITSAPTSGGANTTLSWEGYVDDEDGPKSPRPYWDFGDGSPYAFGENVTHAYAKSGTYTVRLCACDSVTVTVAEATVTIR